MKEGAFLLVAAKRYWKYALWLTAGLSLLALLALNVVFLPIRVDHILVAVAFSLLSSACMAMLVQRAVNARKVPLGEFLVYATLRLLVVIAIIVAYMMMTGERGMRLLPFVGVMSAFFIVLDVLDAAFLVKLQKELESA